ncbi:MAG TPA: HAD-IA family hydrolase [Stellaceae bacterium]|jgi:phosphoglycolate phosphatase|nr:HAD-IA family hydrolase [Stellaceae bacterium]
MSGLSFPAIRRPRAILFDWDNTLVDSWATIHEALNFLMRAMDKPEWSLAETRERVRLSLRESFPLHFGERWEEARGIYLDRFREIHLERLSPLPGREAMLRRLAAERIFLGVVSNKTGQLLRREVAWLGWSEFFGSIVGAGDAPADKPAPEPVHLALAQSGVQAGEDVWFVGDTAVDMQCAENSGCIAVLLGDAQASEEFARFAPRLSFADEAGLFRVLEGLRFDAPRPSS